MEQQKMKEMNLVEIEDDLTPEQIKAYRLADNKTAELAGWDFEALDLELFDIQDIDMEQFGFKPADVTEQAIKDGEEYDLDDFAVDEFECECPRCGFRFNR